METSFSVPVVNDPPVNVRTQVKNAKKGKSKSSAELLTEAALPADVMAESMLHVEKEPEHQAPAVEDPGVSVCEKGERVTVTLNVADVKADTFQLNYIEDPESPGELFVSFYAPPKQYEKIL